MNAWTGPLAAFHRDLLERGKAVSTADGYAKHVEWLRDAVRVGPWDVDAEQLQSWVDGQGWSTHTRRKVLVSLRAFYAYGLNEGECARSPLAGLAAVPARHRGPTRIEPGVQWVEPIAGFVTWMEAGARKRSTIDQRRWWLIRLSETFADPWAVTGMDLALWLSRGDWAPETKRLGRSSVQQFYRWAEINGHVTVSPARELQPVIIPPRPAPTGP
ncbi:MAG: hypothetical protein L0H96_20310 [Humibacillus sp.]|nr:hypothetical protein [Humibacillus sp.]MDN5779240.1 hypothetical protein [Humibacillus sp.]